MPEASQQAGCPATLLSLPSRGWGMDVKDEWTLRPRRRWLHTLMACGVTFHQMVHGDRHGIKARGGMGTSSWPGVVSLENEQQ